MVGFNVKEKEERKGAVKLNEDGEEWCVSKCRVSNVEGWSHQEERKSEVKKNENGEEWNNNNNLRRRVWNHGFQQESEAFMGGNVECWIENKHTTSHRGNFFFENSTK